MFSIPAVTGTIRRRVLVNYCADAAVVQKMLPPIFRPKIHHDQAIVGICLIRLEQIRPQKLPLSFGVSSENAAHRVAVLWDENGIEREGVYIARRDTSSRFNVLAGGRLFPGQHHQAAFDAHLQGDQFKLSMASQDGFSSVEVRGAVSEKWTKNSIFASLQESSAFFEKGSLGYSVRQNSPQLDGLTLQTQGWSVQALQVDELQSSFFADETRFPRGSITFDHALIMQNIAHEWHAAPTLNGAALALRTS